MNLSSSQLHEAAAIQEQIEDLQRRFDALMSGQSAPVPERSAGVRRISAEGRARIAEGQRLRWAKHRSKEGNEAPLKKRTMSAAGKAKIAAAARKRWKKAKAAGRNRL